MGRLTKEEQLWVLNSLFSLASGDDVGLPDTPAGDILELVWREALLMEKRNVKTTNLTGSLVNCADNPLGDPAGDPFTKVKESKVKESKVVGVIEHYEKNFPGTMSSTEFQELLLLEKDFGETNVIKAIDVACLRKRKTLAYVKGILKNENEQGFTWDEGFAKKRTEVKIPILNDLPLSPSLMSKEEYEAYCLKEGIA